MGRRIVRTSSQDLKKLLLNPTGGRFLRPLDAFDQVYPGILLGDASTALSTCLLKELKVTHVLNAAHGKNDDYYGGFVNTSFSNYDQAGIKFMGVPALDSPSFYLRSYFKQGADFIEEALKSGGKVLIHCQCGISRSATLIAAYLMLKKGMDAQEALSTIRAHRRIFPNEGFLTQLCDYEYDRKLSGDITKSTRHSNDLRRSSLDSVYSSAPQNPISFDNFSLWPAITKSRGMLDYDNKPRSRARSEDRYLGVSEYGRDRNPTPVYYRSSSVEPEYMYETVPQRPEPTESSFTSDLPVSGIFRPYYRSYYYPDSYYSANRRFDNLHMPRYPSSYYEPDPYASPYRYYGRYYSPSFDIYSYRRSPCLTAYNPYYSSYTPLSVRYPYYLRTYS